MPYKIRKRKCKQSNNLVGDYIVVKIKPSGKEEKVSCHKTKEKARGAISAKHAASNNEIVKISVDMLRKIIKEEAQKLNEAEGWFLLNPDGSLVNSQKTRTPVWYPDEKRAMSAYDSGYGEEGAAAVALRLVSDPYAYNGSNADPRDLKYAQQARGMEVK